MSYIPFLFKIYNIFLHIYPLFLYLLSLVCFLYRKSIINWIQMTEHKNIPFFVLRQHEKFWKKNHLYIHFHLTLFGYNFNDHILLPLLLPPFFVFVLIELYLHLLTARQLLHTNEYNLQYAVAWIIRAIAKLQKTTQKNYNMMTKYRNIFSSHFILLNKNCAFVFIFHD